VAIVRYAAKGMIHEAFVVPRMFFPLVPGLGPLPPPWMHVVFVVLGLAATCITLGLAARAAAGVFCVLFSYAHFADLTNYLNHYYLVSILCGLLAAMPCDRAFAISRRAHEDTVPTWCWWLLRFQIACVYAFAGLAKLQADWLVRALPLRIWLAGAADVPMVGGWLTRPEAAVLLSWAGAVFDLTIPFLLLVKRTRLLGYAAVVLFHLLTARLFRLGMFPAFMMAASLVFLSPSWPRRSRTARGRSVCVARNAEAGKTGVLGVAGTCALAAWMAIQIAMPLRGRFMSGDRLWSERGFRFAWNVMLMEKTGVADFTVRDRRTGRESPVRLHDHLTPLQVKMMSTQPDLIRAFARHLVADARKNGHEIEAFADVLVSLNGRPPARMFNPDVDVLGADVEPLDGDL
jgi:hypothetical protein